MKKIVFITALFAFVAGSTFAVSSYYTNDGNTVEKVESDKGDKKSKEEKSESEESKSTATATKKDCASKKQCCNKGAKANCSDEKKKDKE